MLFDSQCLHKDLFSLLCDMLDELKGQTQSSTHLLRDTSKVGWVDFSWLLSLLTKSLSFLLLKYMNAPSRRCIWTSCDYVLHKIDASAWKRGSIELW